MPENIDMVVENISIRFVHEADFVTKPYLRGTDIYSQVPYACPPSIRWKIPVDKHGTIGLTC
mgnify:CR=1 FL=1